ncbi:ARL14 effector protein [Teleopsis dalmanni]|uniref:ARL14 effector protein n=1 Tax=Teleopsis dalmanni TaxID=139649 RepID=UPI0018CC8A28|nr:ARL14 effector protein [Teleopsis dalmanni]
MDKDDDLGEGIGPLRMSLRERPRKLHAERKLREKHDEYKYLDDIDDKNRDKRKLKRKNDVPSKSKTIYDEHGVIRHNGLSLCDCMTANCPGCWFPCENCRSTKCGIQCRVNRRFYYDSITFDGKDGTIKNPFC